MPITGPIPLPKPPGSELPGANDMSEILARMLYAKNQQAEQQRLAQMQPYDIALKQAQAQKATQEANSPFAGLGSLTGPAGQIESLEAIKRKYGEHSQPYKDAKKAWDTLQQFRETGGFGGVDLKNKLGLMQQAITDNPGIDMKKANEITNAWLGGNVSGEGTLSDGTPIPKPSGNSLYLLDAMSKKRAGGQPLNQMISAKQSDAELDVLQDYSDKSLKPYGDTYLNYSPSQIVDTFKNDQESQTKLGKFIGGQALQFEIAQIRNRIAMGQPGITSTQEMMNMGKQVIDTRYPMLSQKARQVASDYINEALREGLRARQKVGVGASVAFTPVKSKKESSNKIPIYNPKTGNFE